MEVFEINDNLNISTISVNVSFLQNNTSEYFNDYLPISDVINTTDSSTLITLNTLSTADFVRIAFYLLIFVLAVLGNVLVIVTLTQNKRMRTVTNVFLMNLAVSDLLLGVFCMPFTLVGSLLRNFIFGDVMCRLIPYLQAVTVSVSVWTLVTISMERFFAICRPFRSRQWQTISHSYKVIVSIWVGSLLIMLPIAVLSRLLPTRKPEKYKCREKWPDVTSERAFNVCLDIVLLVVPLFVMTLTYSCVVCTLYQGIKLEELDHSDESNPNLDAGQSCLTSGKHQLTRSRVVRRKESSKGSTSDRIRPRDNAEWLSMERLSSKEDRSSTILGSLFRRDKTKSSHILFSKTSIKKTEEEKRKVVKMLFVVVLEFFICWTPLYVINTWSLYDHHSLYNNIGPDMISAIQLLAYTSSCCNPITYCFMHNKFRYALLAVLGLKKKIRRPSQASDLATLNSGLSIRNSTRTDVSERIDDKLV
ncbi:cholecystokinin receptor type A-like [Tachypleus tridentatus]|uniref:cholecystokinin receptor type A-like n=1 Tax=Tachypleus tridentatus TaxID=6853 RepID=UPI003FD2B555